MSTNAPPASTAPSASTPSEAPSSSVQFLSILSNSLHFINTSVTQKEARYTVRALRNFPFLRNSFQPSVYREAMSALLLKSPNTIQLTNKRSVTANNLNTNNRDVVNGKSNKKGNDNNLVNPNLVFLYKILSTFPALPSTTSKDDAIHKEITQFKDKFPDNFLEKCFPEIEVFLTLLVLVYRINQKQYEEANAVADLLIERIKQTNRRTLDPLNAKAYFYYSRIYELNGHLSDIRQELLTEYRKACVHGDLYSQTTILNLLLRNYLHYDLYGLALKLINKTAFVDSFRSNAQYARYLYYAGCIQAVQLQYSDAHSKLVQALRKCPHEGKAGYGFRLATTKMSIVVSLLMGDIPERSTFNVKEMRRALHPYMSISMAVRSGDLIAFDGAVEKYQKQFAQDRILFLIKRLHHSVIRAGLRMLNLSYSRITLSDIAAKLGLNESQDAESIVSKAILDGVIEAVVNHDKKYVEFKAKTDIYGTSEPMQAFNRRIAFCLQLHSDAVKAMRYPNTDSDKLEKADTLVSNQEFRIEDVLGDDIDLI